MLFFKRLADCIVFFRFCCRPRTVTRARRRPRRRCVRRASARFIAAQSVCRRISRCVFIFLYTTITALTLAPLSKKHHKKTCQPMKRKRPSFSQAFTPCKSCSSVDSKLNSGGICAPCASLFGAQQPEEPFGGAHVPCRGVQLDVF